jgi:hypothetical protein
MRRFAPVMITAMAVMSAGCSDSGSPTSSPQVNFNLATRGPAAAAAGASLSVIGPETFTDGTNTLVLDSVGLVLREIELRRSEATVSCGESPSDDACEKLELGPVLLNLPLGVAGAARAFSVTIPAGTYDEVAFEIHRPSSSDDAAFIQANPDFDGVSIHVSGSFNGTPFDFVSDLNAEEEIGLTPPLTITESAATDLTLFVNLDPWFRDAAGSLIDPTTAAKGQANEGVVKENIQRTLDAFQDNNRDGEDDHGGLDDGSNHT